MKKITFIITLLLLSSNGFGQEEKSLGEKKGVKITYQLLLQEEQKKKDKYILIVNSNNENNSDLYYEVPLVKNNNGELSLPFTPEEQGFTKIRVRNSTGLFGDGKSIIGEQTKLITTNNSILFKIKKGSVLTQETTFKVKKGVKPLVTNSFKKTLKELKDFDLKISPEMLNGDFISSCQEIKVNILFQNSAEKGDYLIQTTNGKQFIWTRKNNTTFIRENSSDFTIIFNKSNNTFNYSTSDGITCVWSKK
ncbi:hypothetical protein [uncultured Polaribacter sp.]|uniref:hypothetical protein n=1 Tax=uncultured Polaribacter sp. TaxID=174711 RepID=UPI002631E033|nr:hypothetical protein [uncultured Polaribacter sp.]